ncbi:MAG: four helix bundle protein [Luteitalea sp.]|nr:four helix bundle protein [Luteitalea sp.]
MNEMAEQLRQRVKRFAIRVVLFVKTLPRDPATTNIAHQLAGSGTGMSANYHAACRGRSRAEFIARLGVVVEEADETEHWLDVATGAELASGAELHWLRGETAELRAIFKASLDTARTNHARESGGRATQGHHINRPCKSQISPHPKS